MSILSYIILLIKQLKGLKMSIKETLENYGITSIYHFTDKANLRLIEKYGIQSLKNIFSLDIPVKHFGAEELSHNLDQRKGLDKYVHLAFIDDHPMYHVAKRRGNLKDPVWIEIDSSILYDQNTLVCDQVANKTGANLFQINKVLDFIDFDIILLKDHSFIRKEARKAEIMAYNEIPTNLIKGITYGN